VIFKGESRREGLLDFINLYSKRCGYRAKCSYESMNEGKPVEKTTLLKALSRNPVFLRNCGEETGWGI